MFPRIYLFQSWSEAPRSGLQPECRHSRHFRKNRNKNRINILNIYGNNYSDLDSIVVKVVCIVTCFQDWNK